MLTHVLSDLFDLSVTFTLPIECHCGTDSSAARFWLKMLVLESLEGFEYRLWYLYVFMQELYLLKFAGEFQIFINWLGEL